MAGSLNVPNTFQTQSGNVPASELDDNNTTIETYVNIREVTIGLVAARPAAGVAGRWFFATDVGVGTLYVDNGSTWTAVGVPSGSGITPTSQVFLSGTAATYTTPSNVRYIEIELIGGGGGGAGGNIISDATAGTASTWSGGSLSAGGGAAGSLAAATAGSIAANGNIINIAGAGGHAPATLATVSAGGPGANSVFGGGGAPSQPGANAGGSGVANTGGGAAGGGVGPVNNPGGGGGAGAYVRHRIASPAATYTYTVGAGGTAGTAGANAGAGGSGGSGIIIVTEYY